MEVEESEGKEDNISIEEIVNKNNELDRYKNYVRQNVEQIVTVLRRLEGMHP